MGPEDAKTSNNALQLLFRIEFLCPAIREQPLMFGYACACAVRPERTISQTIPAAPGTDRSRFFRNFVRFFFAVVLRGVLAFRP